MEVEERQTQWNLEHGQCASTYSIYVTGDYLEGNTLFVAPRNYEYGDFIWNGEGEWVWPGSTFEYAGVGTVSCCLPSSEKIDKIRVDVPDQILVVRLVEDISIQIDRYTENIDLRITMAPLSGGQVGWCGNFNNKPVDDKALACGLGRHYDVTKALLGQPICLRTAAPHCMPCPTCT